MVLYSCPMVAGGAAIAVLAGAVHAGSVPPNFMMGWDVAGDSEGRLDFNWNLHGGVPVYGDHIIPGSEETWTGWRYEGSLARVNEWTLSWTTVFSEPGTSETAGGSIITASILVTNNMSTTDNFMLQLTLPVTKPLASPYMRGDIRGTLSDQTFDSAYLSAPAGGRIYAPQIDGVDETDGYMMLDGYSVSAGTLEQKPFGPEQFGIPVPIGASQDADSSIGIVLDFDLTAGDSVSWFGTFEILPVPGVGGLPVLAALGCCARRRRRRFNRGQT